MDVSAQPCARLTPPWRPTCRRAAWLAIVLAGLALMAPPAIGQQTQVPPQPHLTTDVRSRLAQAARDSALSPWQREFMLAVSRHEEMGADIPPSVRPSLAETRGDDGTWLPIPPPAGSPPLARAWHAAIYDPVRDRMVVFGGNNEGAWLNDVWELSLAESPVWSEISPLGRPPSGRLGHTAIYDPVRDRMVVFGGYSAPDYPNLYRNDVWALSLGGSPAWSEIIPAGSPPSGRERHTAIYDPVRDRMLVFGGRSAGYSTSDVWVLSLAGSPAWSALTVLGSPPAARNQHSATYDPIRDRMVVFGGQGVSVFGDVWALSLTSTPAWSEISPAGSPPIGRVGHSAIYDPVRDRLVVFGGVGADGQDVSALSLAGNSAWSALIPAGSAPQARLGHTAIYDPVRDRMVVSDGGANIWYFADAWELSLAGSPAWSALSLDGSPPSARAYHTAVYDPVRDRMVVFGGFDPIVRNDVWSLSLTGSQAWGSLSPSGSPPMGRVSQTAIYDPVRDRMVVFGGMDETNQCRNDVWALSLSGNEVWSELTPAGSPPPPRGAHTAIYDPVRDRMLVFGGYNCGGVRFNDVWALSLAGNAAWSEITPAGSAPAPRLTHTAIYDPVRNRMVVFGGQSQFGYHCDVWALSLSGSPLWSPINPTGNPPSDRFGHTAIYDPVRDRMVVFGGFGDGWLNDVWSLSLGGSQVWSDLAPVGSPPGVRYSHTAIYDPVRDRMMVFGGMRRSFYNDVITLMWKIPNRPPDCSSALASEAVLWPPNHQYRPISILGVTDPDGDPVTVSVTSITQDEPVNGRGDGATCPDARIVDGQASVRAERSASGNGRAYAVRFTAEDGRGGRSDGTVMVCVPNNHGGAVCLDDGQKYASPESCRHGGRLIPETASLEVGTAGHSAVGIHFELSEGGRVDVAVFDVAGRRRATIESGELTAGAHERVWRFDGVPKGLYFVRMRTAASALTQRVLVTQ